MMLDTEINWEYPKGVPFLYTCKLYSPGILSSPPQKPEYIDKTVACFYAWVFLFFQKQEKEWQPEDAPLRPITSNHFAVSKVPSDCTVGTFCQDNKLEPSRNNTNILLELNSVDQSSIGKAGIRDVILMDKVLQWINLNLQEVYPNIFCICRKVVYLLVLLHALIFVFMRKNGGYLSWPILKTQHH